MHTHGYHSHCKHDLSYCEHCDVCYCEKCGREWGQKATITYTYNPYIWTYRGIPYTVTYGNGNYTITTSNGTLVTNQDVIGAFHSSVKNDASTSYHAHTSK